MKRAVSAKVLLPLAVALFAALFLSACTQKTADPWINEGQEQRLAGKHERDQQTAEHLRDRMAGQSQR
jgi:hypothetical protein